MNSLYHGYQDIKHQLKQLKEIEEISQNLPEEFKQVRKERLDDYKRRIRRDIRILVKESEPMELCDTLRFDHSGEFGGRVTTYYKVFAPSRDYMEDFIAGEIRRVDSPYDCSGQ